MFKIIGLFLIGTTLLTSCKKDKEPVSGKEGVKIEVNAFSVEQPNLKSTQAFTELFSVSPDEVTNVRVGIDGTIGNPLTTKLLSFSLNNGFGETEVITLLPGLHSLTNLELLKNIGTEQDPIYEVLYSAVADGAYLSSFVSSTIPLEFNVLSGMPPNVISIDAVGIDEWLPEDFGFSKFDVGFITATPLYFYGADDNENPSIMSIDVIKDENVIYTGNSVNGTVKIYYPDYYNLSDNSEMLTFNLVKDGELYTQTLSVTTLKTWPREVIMLNIPPSLSMAGFTEIPTLTFSMDVFEQNNNNAQLDNRIIVKNISGTTIWQSGTTLTSGRKDVEYIDMPANDANEYYDIIVMYNYNGAKTKTARLSVATLKSFTYPTHFNSLQEWLYNTSTQNPISGITWN